MAQISPECGAVSTIVRNAESFERIRHYIENLQPNIEKNSEVGASPGGKKVIDFPKVSVDACISEGEEKINLGIFSICV